jgi:PAS domain S-box-containing protein
MLLQFARLPDGITYRALHSLLTAVGKTFNAREVCIVVREGDKDLLVVSSLQAHPKRGRRYKHSQDTVSTEITFEKTVLGRLDLVKPASDVSPEQLAPFADAAAHIVAQAAALTSARETAEETKVLRELGLQLGEHNRLEPFLRTVVSSARRLLRADYASVALLEEDGSSRWVYADGTRTDKYKQFVFKPGDGTAGSVASARGPVVHEGIGQSPGLPASEHPIHTAEGGVSAMGVPLMRAGQPFGALIVASRKERHWKQEEIELASVLANTAAVASDKTQSAADERAQRAFLEKAMESFPGVLLVVGPPPDYRVRLLNSRMAAYLPAPFNAVETARGRTLSEISEGISRAGQSGQSSQSGSMSGLALLTQVYESGEAVSYEQYETSDSTGARTYWNWSIVPVGERDTHEGRSLLVLAHDITDLTLERRRSQQAAADARSRAEELAAVINQMVDGVLICDEMGRAIKMNPAAEHLLGEQVVSIESDEQASRWTGRLLTSTGEKYDHDRLPAVRAARGELVIGEQMELRRPDGEMVMLNASASPLYDNEGKVTGSVLVLRDITKEKLVEKLKDEFLSVVSHELRTPLSAIMGYSDLMLRGVHGPLSDRQARALKAVRANSNRLLHLINDVLDMSKLDSGVVPVTLEPVNLSAVAARTVANMRVLALEAEVTVRNRIADNLWVTADEHRLQQVFENLLGNATKFTPPGGVITLESRLSAHASDDESLAGEASTDVGPGKARSVVVSIHDTGTGLESDQLERIWDRFYQVDGTAKRRTGGTGLGLTIVRGLLELQGGLVWAESAGPSMGSTFSFSLPVSKAPAQTSEGQGRDRSPMPAREDGRKRQLILVAEDDADQREIICEMLEMEGYEVVLASDGEEASRLATELHPSVVALDVLLPRHDGWEVLGNLKSNAATRDIPVMIISVVDHQAFGRKLGADEYLLKPIDPVLLRESMRRLVSVSGRDAH